VGDVRQDPQVPVGVPKLANLVRLESEETDDREGQKQVTHKQVSRLISTEKWKTKKKKKNGEKAREVRVNLASPAAL
jgi:hypothetical protein